MRELSPLKKASAIDDGPLVCRAVLDLLKNKGVSFQLFTHDPVLTILDVENQHLFPQEALLKTQVFRIEESGWVLVVLRGRDKVDYRKLAVALSVRRKDLKRPKAAEIESALGYQRGGASPIPSAGVSKVLFDEQVLAIDLVYCGIGRNDRTLEIGIVDLLRLSGADVHPLARTPIESNANSATNK